MSRSQYVPAKLKIQLPTTAPLTAPGKYQPTTFHSISGHDTRIRVGLAMRLAIVMTGATILTRMMWVTMPRRIRLPPPPEKMPIIQLMNPATSS